MMISVYLVIAIVCVILLVVMASLGGFGLDHDAGVGGHDMDMGHYDAGHGDYTGSHLSPLSLPILLAFGATFGAVGAILTEVLFDEIWTVVAAVIIGIIVAGGMYGLVYVFLVKSQASTHISVNEFVGLEGLLTVAIRNKEPGQVVVNTEKRGRVPIPATANEDIESNTPVKVIGIAGDAVMVEKKKEG